MESRDKGRACWISPSRFECVCGKLSTYTTNPPQGGQCHDMRKEQKNGAMSDSRGKNRSYVKINLSVLQHLLHKHEQKKKKKTTCEKRLSPSEAICRDPLLSSMWRCRGDVAASARGRGLQQLSTHWMDRTLAGADTVLLKPQPLPGSGTDVLHYLGKSWTLHTQVPFPKMRPRKVWVVVKTPLALLPCRLSPPLQLTC